MYHVSRVIIGCEWHDRTINEHPTRREADPARVTYMEIDRLEKDSNKTTNTGESAADVLDGLFDPLSPQPDPRL